MELPTELCELIQEAMYCEDAPTGKGLVTERLQAMLPATKALTLLY